ncbi:MAG: phenylalanine--tRNA ligase beta subunit-related protein, partial [Chloroflexota bacterium]
KLPTAVFDTAQIEGGIRVHYSNGQERFTPLFEKEVKHPEVGEVVFSDENQMVVARRWCWRQSDQSAAREGTTNAIIVVEAQHQDSEEDVQAALADWLTLLSEYSGGEFKSALLGPKEPSLLR